MQDALIRVMVVEDHHVVRAGLVALLSMAEDLEVVAQAGDGIEAIEQFRAHLPDVSVIDLRLPGLPGAEVIRTLRRESEGKRFIVLTAHDGEEDVYRAVRAGARAYLLKGSTNQELIEVIRSVYEGKSHFPPEIAAALARRLSGHGLTGRESEILEKIVLGMTNNRIAATLGISESTVKVHVNSIMRKLGVADRTQAATVAIQRGIVSLDRRETGYSG